MKCWHCYLSGAWCR